MTAKEADKALMDIVRAEIVDCESRLAAVSREAVNEVKALRIERGMYGFCMNAGFLENTNGSREGVLKTRRRVMENLMRSFPRARSRFDAADESEKQLFVAALQAEIFLRDQFLKRYVCDLVSAKESGDVGAAFELGIKIGVLQKVFALWEEWRKENGVYSDLLEEVPA